MRQAAKMVAARSPITRTVMSYVRIMKQAQWPARSHPTWNAADGPQFRETEEFLNYLKKRRAIATRTNRKTSKTTTTI
jgi:hypothetical protein